MFFNLYGHGKLDLSLFMAGPISRLEARRFVQKRFTHQRPKLPRKINNRNTSFREKGFSFRFSCRHICLGKQWLPQKDICCREVVQDNKITSSMGQPLLDACSILEKRLQGSRVDFEFLVLRLCQTCPCTGRSTAFKSNGWALGMSPHFYASEVSVSRSVWRV